jgi:hypothetical protein
MVAGNDHLRGRAIARLRSSIGQPPARVRSRARLARRRRPELRPADLVQDDVDETGLKSLNPGYRHYRAGYTRHRVLGVVKAINRILADPRAGTVSSIALTHGLPCSTVRR